MGKNLEGKKTGAGIIWKKSGLYAACYVDRFSKDITKCSLWSALK